MPDGIDYNIGQGGAYSVSGPDGTASFSYNGDQYVTKAWGQQVSAGGSPLVVAVVPPIGPLSQIDFGELYRRIIAMVG